MHESSGYQNTCAEMFTEKEDLGWNLHPFDFLSHYRESTSADTGKEHNDCRVVRLGGRLEGSSTYKLLQHATGSHIRLPLPNYHT